MKRVTGIGGIFFKSDDPESTRKWYQKHLGIKSGEYGGTFEWRFPAALRSVPRFFQGRRQ